MNRSGAGRFFKIQEGTKACLPILRSQNSFRSIREINSKASSTKNLIVVAKANLTDDQKEQLKKLFPNGYLEELLPESSKSTGRFVTYLNGVLLFTKTFLYFVVVAVISIVCYEIYEAEKTSIIR